MCEWGWAGRAPASGRSVSCLIYCVVTCLSFHRRLIRWVQKKSVVSLSIAFVADESETAAERGFKRVPVAGLQGLREASLLGVLLPLVDGVRDGNAFDDFDWLGFTTQYTRHAAGAQPPLCV